ncbi:hypothetical protein B296_00007627 [Ensete ventricosum]|uniref:Uncharacterized protein n=1 Tax=Ensete ventricosum TaxID=4639 RepID=A0A427ADC2_ENSVE|nr:hypothetical protein B296_00007627 [Ensete ventricosum]
MSSTQSSAHKVLAEVTPASRSPARKGGDCLQSVTYRMRRWAACARSDAAQVITCAQGGMTSGRLFRAWRRLPQRWRLPMGGVVAYRKATTASKGD